MAYIICVACEKKMTLSIGEYLVTMAFDPPTPYEIYSCDIWTCPQCGTEVVTGMGTMPLYQHWQPDFEAYYQRLLSKRDAGMVRVVYEYEKGRPLT